MGNCGCCEQRVRTENPYDKIMIKQQGQDIQLRSDLDVNLNQVNRKMSQDSIGINSSGFDKMDDVPDEQNDDVAENDNISTRETKTSENNNKPKFA